MKTIILVFLLSVMAFGQTGKSNLTQQQKDSIGAMIRDSIGYVTPENFGAIADGVTDDASALSQTFTYAIANGLKVSLTANKTYLTSALKIDITSDIIIEGNNAKIISGNVSNGNGFLYARGSEDAADTLDIPINMGSFYMDVPSGSNVLNAEVGSLIKVLSDSVIEATLPLGELKKVLSVDGTRIYFSECFYMGYDTSENVRAILINPISVTIKDLEFVSNNQLFGYGVKIEYADNPVIENFKVSKATYAGVYITDSFYPRVDADVIGANQVGYGYGITLNGAVTGGNITINALDCRHAFTNGGMSTGGMNWNVNVINSTSRESIGNTYSFGTHATSGSVRFVNCTAYHYLPYSDSTRFQGTWDVSTTYDSSDIVSYNNKLFYSNVNSNTGNNPANYVITYWQPYSSGSSHGFYLGSGTSVTNCKVYGAVYGAWVHTLSPPYGNINVDGLTATDCDFGVYITDSLTNSSFNNVRLNNSVNKDSPQYALSLTNADGDSAIVKDVTFNNITGINAGALIIQASGDIKAYFGSVRGKVIRVGGQINPVSLYINSFICDFDSTSLTPVSITANTTTDINVNIGNMGINNLYKTAVLIGDDIQSFSIGNVSALALNDVSNFASITTNSTIQNFSVGSLFGMGATISKGISVEAGSLINNLYFGSVGGTALSEYNESDVVSGLIDTVLSTKNLNYKIENKLNSNFLEPNLIPAASSKFTTDGTGWYEPNNATFTWNPSGYASLTQDGYGFLYKFGVIEVGKTYKVSFKAKSDDYTGTIDVKGGTGTPFTTAAISSTWVAYAGDFTVADNQPLYIETNTSGTQTIDFDDIIIQKYSDDAISDTNAVYKFDGNEFTPTPIYYTNIKGDSTSLPAEILMPTIPSDSTGLSTGTIYFDSITGALRRKF